MSLESIFPGRIAVRESWDVFPGAWNALFALSREAALEAIADCIGLTRASAARLAICSSRDLAVIVPTDPSVRLNANFWQLAVAIRPDTAFYFFFSRPNLRIEEYSFPLEYLRICRTLGVCNFSQFSGSIALPDRISKLEGEVLSRTRDTWVKRISPFYHQGTGDYDCWVNEDYQTVWYWDHETGHVEKLPLADGFVSWFECQCVQAWGL